MVTEDAVSGRERMDAPAVRTAMTNTRKHLIDEIRSIGSPEGYDAAHDEMTIFLKLRVGNGWRIATPSLTIEADAVKRLLIDDRTILTVEMVCSRRNRCRCV